MSALIDYSRYEEYYSSQKKRWPRLFLFLIVIIPLALLFVKLSQSSEKNTMEFVNPLALGIQDERVKIDTDSNSSELALIVANDLEDASGSYAVAIKNLKTGEKYLFNENQIFDTASLYKLFVMATAFEQIKSGDLDPERVLSQKIPILNEKFDIATESAELKEGSITLRVKDALTKMITISDNYSALLLTETVRISKITQFLNTNGFSQSKMGTANGAPITTASDLLLFFEKLYKGDLADANQTQAMITLLKNQKLNNKLPKYLPEKIEMAHKTGELGRISHDGGIVYTETGAYIIIILSETSIPLEANEKMANISKNVYKYFAD